MKVISRVILIFILWSAMFLSILFLIDIYPTSTNSVAYAQSTETHSLFFGTYYKNWQGYTSTLTLENPSSTTVSFTATLFASDTGLPQKIITQTIRQNALFSLPDNSSLLADIPNELYGLKITSTGQLAGVVHVYRPTINNFGDRFAAYSGMSTGQITTVFSPIYKNYEGYNSNISIFNVNTTTVTATIEVFNNFGVSLLTSSTVISPNAIANLPVNTMADLAENFSGWMKITSTQPTVSLLTNNGVRFFQIDTPNDKDSAQYLSRVMKTYDDGAGNRTTRLFLVNDNNTEAFTNIVFNPSHSTSAFSIPVSNTLMLDIANTNDVLSNSVQSTLISSGNDLYFSEETLFDDFSFNSTATYRGGSSLDYYIYQKILPYVIKEPNHYTVVSFINMASNNTSFAISFWDTHGVIIFNEVDTIPAGPGSGPVRYNLSQMPALGSNFEGSIVIASDGPIDAIADEYLISPSPALDISITAPITVMIHSPFTYTLTVTNTSPTPASDLTIITPIPNHTTYLRSSDGGIYMQNTNTVSWTLASLESHTPVTRQVVVSATNFSNIVNNGYYVTAYGNISATGTISISTQVQLPYSEFLPLILKN